MTTEHKSPAIVSVLEFLGWWAVGFYVTLLGAAVVVAIIAIAEWLS